MVDRKMREMGYIRKPAVDELKNRRSLRDRVAAEGAPEVRQNRTAGRLQYRLRYPPQPRYTTFSNERKMKL